MDERLSFQLDVPQFLPWLEADAPALGDVHAGTGLDVPPHPALAGPWLEHAKPSDLDAVPVQEGLLHSVGEEVNYLEGRGLGYGQGLHQGLGDVDLDHEGLGLEVTEGGGWMGNSVELL